MENSKTAFHTQKLNKEYLLLFLKKPLTRSELLQNDITYFQTI